MPASLPEALLRTLWKDVDEGVVLFDARGRVRDLNAPAERMLGWSRAAARGRSGSEVLRSPATGTFHARVRMGQNVVKGTLLGVVTDFFGNMLHEIRAPFAGEVLYVVGTPPMREGEPVAMVGRIKAD